MSSVMNITLVSCSIVQYRNNTPVWLEQNKFCNCKDCLTDNILYRSQFISLSTRRAVHPGDRICTGYHQYTQYTPFAYIYHYSVYVDDQYQWWFNNNLEWSGVRPSELYQASFDRRVWKKVVEAFVRCAPSIYI